MYGKLNGEGIEYAPINYETEDGNLILNFNKNEQLMTQYGYKMVIEQIPEYNIDTEDIYISGYQETDENITIIYSVTTKSASKEFATEAYVQESVNGVINWLTEVEAVVYGNKADTEEAVSVAYGNKAKIGESELVTEDKTITGAINELFLDVDNGKQLIATAIDNENITGDSTFDAMSEAIRELKENGTNSNLSIEDMLEATDICVNYENTFILKEDGTLYYAGDNLSRLSGITGTDIKTFTQVPNMTDVKEIACGREYSIALKNDGTLWGCGTNGNGELGLGSTYSFSKFTQITTNTTNIKQISCGYRQTFAVKNDGSLWSCGYNYYGVLGFGDTTSRKTFTQVPDIEDVKKVACGEEFAFILKNDGTLWSCGNNDEGQLGLGDTNSRNTFTQVTDMTDVKEVYCGLKHTFVIKNDGTIWACGNSYYGQLGLGENNTTDKLTFTQVPNMTDVKEIACGYDFTIILKNDGTLWGTGLNGSGQLGLENNRYYTFTQITENINYDVKQVNCGRYCSVILKNDGDVFGAGYNSYGQLGLNGGSNVFTRLMDLAPIVLGELSTLGNSLRDEGVKLNIGETLEDLSIKTDEEFDKKNTEINNLETYIDTNAFNLYDIMSVNEYDVNEDETLDELIKKINEDYIRVTDIKQVISGYQHTFILKNDGTLYSCGYNSYGQLGLGQDVYSTSIFKKIDIDDVKEVICGEYHTLVIKNDGTLWGCGYNNYGQLGIADNVNYKYKFEQISDVTNIKQVVAGYSYSYVLKNDGTLWSCGDNSYGHLGFGDLVDKNVFTQVPNMTDVKEIAGGYAHIIALKNDGTLWSCGYNGDYQLGLGDYNNRYEFTQITSYTDKNIKQISCGKYHSTMLTDDGTIWACGNNSYGQSGLGDTSNRNVFTQVTTNINNDVVQMNCGRYCTFIIKKDRTVWVCGQNGSGQLGLGDTSNRNVFTQVTININNDVKQISSNDYHSVILKNDGTVWSTGNNGSYQLGQPNIKSTNHFKQVFYLKNIKENYNEEYTSILYKEMKENGYENVPENLSLETLINTLRLNGIEPKDIKQISSSKNHAFVLKYDGTLWGCGYNSYGQLGLGVTSNRNVFTQVTTNINNDVKQVNCVGDSTFIIKNDGSLWCCGCNSYGQLGFGDTTTNIYIFTQVPNITDVKQVAGGLYHTAILKNDNSLWVCGDNSYGALGLGDSVSNKNVFTQVTGNIGYDVKQIACGNRHSIVIKNDGTVWGSGYNSYGQLGLNDTTDKKLFTQATNITDAKQVVCGENNTYIIKNDGSLWACGDNSYGQLGIGSNNSKNVFTQVTKNINYDVRQMSSGFYHILIIKNDGSLWACGYNNYGQLGIGSNDSSFNTFVQVSDAMDISEVSCNRYSTYIIKSDGSLWSCGYNNYYQLGLEEGSNKNTFTQVTINMKNGIKQVAYGIGHTMILKNDGTVWGTGDNDNGQLGLGDNVNRNIFTQVPNMTNVKQIACGDYCTLVLKNDGTVWGTGDNYDGQLGLGDNVNRNIFTQVPNIKDIKEITCGGYHTFVLKDNGTLWCCGRNDYGQLGLNDLSGRTLFAPVGNFENVKQVACGTNHTFVVKNDGGLWGTGQTAYGQLGTGDTTEIKTFTQITTNINYDVKQISSKKYCTMILKNDDTLWGCGYNDRGQLGLGDSASNEITTFTQITTNATNIKQIFCGGSHSFVLKSDGTIWGCGHNNYGQLGFGDTTTRNTLTQVPDTTDIGQIACGDYCTLVLKNDGTVWGTGDNYEGQLGLGDNVDRDIFTQVTINMIDGIKQMSSGLNHTAILKNDGTVWTCGYNNYGQLGFDDTTTRKTFTRVPNLSNVKQISCGPYNIFAVKNDGTVWGCGDNYYSQLGLGDTTARKTFTQVPDMTNAKEVISGETNTYIITNNGTLWACGYNSNGQLGLGDTTTRKTFVEVTTNISYDVEQVACGEYFTIILKNDGTVWGSGYNSYGQLGLGDTNSRNTFTQVTTNINNDVKEISCGYRHVSILKYDGTVWGTGYNYNGQLGTGDTDNRETFTQASDITDVKHITGGRYHVVALKNDGALWVCGDNSYGALGLGNTTQKETFVQVDTNINNIKMIICGVYQTFIMNNNDNIWACGRNKYGQLNTNDKINRDIFTLIYESYDERNLSIEKLREIKLYNFLSGYGCEVESGMNLDELLLGMVAYNSEDGVIENSLTALFGNKSGYVITDVEGASYNFALNSTGYYESTNKGIDNSASLCKLYIYNPNNLNVKLHCINYAENNYDYGIISERNTPLLLSYTADTTYLKNFKGLSYDAVQVINLSPITGWYYIKFRKDGSSASYNDSFQFKVVIG